MKILLAKPRGFCAGVDRAVDIVELALQVYDHPVYVKHQIVHNRTVVADLEAKGAVFVEKVEEIPEGCVVVFSAHGSAPDEYSKALERNLNIIDATCPLVTKVHLEAKRYAKEGKFIVYIGHRGHPEPIGVLGEIEAGQYALIENIDEVDDLTVPEPENVVLLTQTTLSVDDTKNIGDALKQKYPKLILPPAADICYATTNRQESVKQIADLCDIFIVLGSQNSSNSARLRDVAQNLGSKAYLIDNIHEAQDEWFMGVETVGISAGASAPEKLVEEAVLKLYEKFGAVLEDGDGVTENIRFTLPRSLIEEAMANHVGAAILPKYN